MRLPLPVVLTLILVFGFMSASTLYYYNKSRQGVSNNKISGSTFSGNIPQNKPLASSEVDQLTKPAEAKGRLSYPANTYTVGDKETLFAIGTKFKMSWQLVKLANGITNENLIQAGNILVIPKVDPDSEYYRVYFIISDSKASDLNRELRDTDTSDLYNSLFIAKRDAAPYFGIKGTDDFKLLEEDLSKGTALVEVKSADRDNFVGLVQPRVKGKKGFWAILYVENRV